MNAVSAVMEQLNLRQLGPIKADEQGLNYLARGLVIAALILFFLYVGQPFLKPLVIAGLLSFILAPIITKLRRWGVWRAPAVVSTVGAALLFLAVVGGTIVYQLTELATDLPQYEATLQDKAKQLSHSRLTSNALEKASAKLEELGAEISRQREAAKTAPKPLLVEVLTPEPRGLQSIAAIVNPLISPLTTLALVVLFLLFILLERQDLRDRFLRLAGTGDLHRTTVALDDAGERLSGYFLMQGAINLGFGIVIFIGLMVIGIPHAALWGIMASLLRYVPFVGTAIAAFFPTLLAAAVDPGWNSVWWTIGLFSICELVARQVLEPAVYGPHTGLSPVAVVMSTLLWTLLWGPLGLLLATPLTVCLVVLGRHIEAFKFIEVLLGDEPALEPEERFYQRLLAGDAAEASDVAEEAMETMKVSEFYDAVPMKALTLAQYDVAQGKLSAEAQGEILDTIRLVMEDTDEFDDADRKLASEDDAGSPDAAAAAPELESVTPENLKEGWEIDPQVICTEGRGSVDFASALLLGQILRKRGLTVREWESGGSAGKSLDENARRARIVCVTHFEAGLAVPQVRFIIRRMRRQMPQALFIACVWTTNADKKKLEEWRQAAGADRVADSIVAAARICIEEAIDRHPAPGREAKKLVEKKPVEKKPVEIKAIEQEEGSG